MKQLLLFFLIGLFSSLSQPSYTQPPLREIQYEQGKLIGNLPYGRYFFIIGSSLLPNGAPADKVTVEIWNTGNVKFRRNQKLRKLSDQQIQSITAERPMVKSSWNATKSRSDTSLFKVYINQTLQARTQYLIRISFFKNFVFRLIEEERNEIIQNIESEAFAIFRRDNEINSRTLRQLINAETKKILQRKLNLSENQFFEGAAVNRKDVLPGEVIDNTILEELANIIGQISTKQNAIEKNNQDIAFEIKPILDTADPGTEDFIEALEAQRELEAQNDRLKVEKDGLQLQFLDNIQVIKSQLVRVSSAFVVVQPDDYSVAELDAVNIGTSFGGAIVGLNLTDGDNTDFDAFGYSGLKFHFMPIDKRINDPYLDVFFLSRLSFLVGISFTSNFDYKGDELEKVLGFYPVLGFSYDVNRYFGIDLGTTLFRQNSLSPENGADKLRLGPVIGLGLDIDLLNRFKTMFSGEQYNINPDPNN